MKYNISFNIRIIMAPQQTPQQRKSKVGIFKPKQGFDLEEDEDDDFLPFDHDSLYTPILL